MWCLDFETASMEINIALYKLLRGFESTPIQVKRISSRTVGITQVAELTRPVLAPDCMKR
jgi:hypothetical protein